MNYTPPTHSKQNLSFNYLKQTTEQLFLCTNCDAQYTKWAGRCLECGKWGTIENFQAPMSKRQDKTSEYPPTKTQTLKDIASQHTVRKKTGIHELDTVLGGGIVPGSLLLMGGEPGIGKSTLALQLAALVSPALYISGEESLGQIKMRADRLNIHAQGLSLANETNVERIAATIREQKPAIAIIDSIQTIFSDEVSGEIGGVNQVRVCATKLLDVAKSSGVAVIIIGHVTKDGSVAGPKTLEHLVDTVLSFEGEKDQQYRILRATKNRFGPTDEVGIFEMIETGLAEVKNASACFLKDRGDDVPGNIVTCLMEGKRPLLVEIQALVNKTAFGYPVRKASGFDLNRLHVLVAVLQKRANINLAQYDIHINVVGGIKAEEPASDLAVCLAIVSSYKDKPLGKDVVVFGEVGLGGEVRAVSHRDKRIKECEALQMKKIITAQAKKKTAEHTITIIGVKNIQELITQT
ncbi:MAG TPA: DNA repair protein RadA [Candidatus Magasanikbacteria bacterium]|nr:DNA repair protein RadA [Candidatus Magasanikbacteria bacterium]